MKRSALILTLMAGVAAGCTQFPELDRTLTPELQGSDYPTLVPLDPLLARAAETGVEPVKATAAIDARLEALRARAAGLRGSVLTGAERQRLAQGLR